VAGDGTGDRQLARGVAAAPSAWWPGPAHRLAYVDTSGRVVMIDTDSGRLLWRSASADVVTGLAWSSDGRRLLAVAPRALRQFDASGRLVGTLEMPARTRAETATFRPLAHEFALVSHMDAGDRSRLEVVEFDDGAARRRQLLAGAGRFGDVAWAPDGDWLLAGWKDADQWVFIRTGRGAQPAVERLRAVGNISSQFDPGGRGVAGFPGLGGWCCAPVGRPK
jgi:hypothetical protein